MDAAELRAMQAPIKERYKQDPSAAVITLKAKGSTDGEGLTCKVETDAPQDKLDLLLKLTERYCVVYQTIKNGPKVSVSMKRI